MSLSDFLAGFSAPPSVTIAPGTLQGFVLVTIHDPAIFAQAWRRMDRPVASGFSAGETIHLAAAEAPLLRDAVLAVGGMTEELGVGGPSGSWRYLPTA